MRKKRASLSCHPVMFLVSQFDVFATVIAPLWDIKVEIQEVVIVKYHKFVNEMYVALLAMIPYFRPCSVTYPVQYVDWVLPATNL